MLQVFLVQHKIVSREEKRANSTLLEVADQILWISGDYLGHKCSTHSEAALRHCPEDFHSLHPTLIIPLWMLQIPKVVVIVSVGHIDT